MLSTSVGNTVSSGTEGLVGSTVSSVGITDESAAISAAIAVTACVGIMLTSIIKASNNVINLLTFMPPLLQKTLQTEIDNMQISHCCKYNSLKATAAL